MRSAHILAILAVIVAVSDRSSAQTESGATTRLTRGDLEGKWIYRSFRPGLPLNTLFNDIKFGEGVIEFRLVNQDTVNGSLDMGGGYVLRIEGKVVSDPHGKVSSVIWRGTGVPGTETDGWIYDYEASVAPTFQGQTNVTPTLLGQTIRTVQHGTAPAGVTGPFFMVRQVAQPPAEPPALEIMPRMSLSAFAEMDKYEIKTVPRQNPAPGDPASDVVVVRDDRSPEAKRRLESLMRGVRVMKSRKPSDPKSWFFQAAVHGVNELAIEEAADRDPGVIELIKSGGARKFWNQCPHNGEPSADFLVWHRAYIYYFERILREASGDPTLSLPYWDYTGQEVRLPAAFRFRHIPNPTTPLIEVPTNPLFDADREFAIAQRMVTRLDERITLSWEGMEQLPGLKDETKFFGKSELDGLAGGVYDTEANTKGLIESNPHDNVHIAVGGMIRNESGRLAEVTEAAHDPIFWVHHSNIDRLWTRWDNLPNRTWGYFPNAAWFKSTPWSFYDADGQEKKHERAFYFDNTKLGVRYDDVVEQPGRLSATLPFDLQKLDVEIARLDSQLAPNNTGGTALTRPTMLDVAGGKLAVAKKFKARIPAPKVTPQHFLLVNFTRPEVVPNVGFDVIVEFPNRDGKASARRVGSLVLFGLGHHHGQASGAGEGVGAEAHDKEHDLDRSSPTESQRFNVTELMAAPGFDTSKAVVKLAPYSLRKSDEAPEPQRSGDVKVVDFKFVE